MPETRILKLRYKLESSRKEKTWKTENKLPGRHKQNNAGNLGDDMWRDRQEWKTSIGRRVAL